MNENVILEDAKQVPDNYKTSVEPMTEDAKNIAMIMSLSSQNDALRNDPEISNLFEFIEKNGSKKGAAPNKQSAQDSEESDTKNNQEESTEEKESVFFAKKEDPTNKYDLATQEGLSSYLKENFGTDKVDKFVKSANEWKQGSEKAISLEKNLNEVNNFLTGLPDPIYNAIEAYYYGRDWNNELASANSKIKFDKDFEDNNAFEVVTHYFPDQFTKEDFEENTELAQKATAIAKRNFELDRERKMQEKQAMSQNLENQTKVIQSSVVQSLSGLRKTFPSMSDGAIKKVEKMLQTGDYKKLFINDDGTFSADAAKNIALALYGDQEIRRIERGKAVGEANETVEKVLSRGTDKVKKSNSGHTPNANGQGNEFLKFMSGYMSPNSTYSAKQ